MILNMSIKILCDVCVFQTFLQPHFLQLVTQMLTEVVGIAALQEFAKTHRFFTSSPL
jgi:hypothetical protein